MTESQHPSQHQPEQSQLGKTSAYADQYDPSLLFPLPRQTKRDEIGISATPPFLGADLWTAYELSWLNPRGKPQVAIAQVTVPCESPNIIESKSFKLYLNSFNNTRFADAAEVLERLRTDISEAVWRGGVVQSSIGVKLIDAALFDREPVHELDGLNLDRLDIECTRYTPAPELLTNAQATQDALQDAQPGATLPAPASPVTSRKGKLWNSERICSANSEPNQKANAMMPWAPKTMTGMLSTMPAIA